MNRLTDSFASDTDTLLSDSRKEDTTEVSISHDPHSTASEQEDSGWGEFETPVVRSFGFDPHASQITTDNTNDYY